MGSGKLRLKGGVDLKSSRLAKKLLKRKKKRELKCQGKLLGVESSVADNEQCENSVLKDEDCLSSPSGDPESGNDTASRPTKRLKEDNGMVFRSKDADSHVGNSEIDRCGDSETANEVIDPTLSGLTAAEMKFELRRRQREHDRIQKIISKTHRQKIDEFNEKLSKLTEHNDIPKVSAAGNG